MDGPSKAIILLQNPRRVKVENITATTAVVRWAKPLNAVGDVQYRILLSTNAGDSYVTRDIVQERTYLLDELTPGHIYFLCITTYNELSPPPHWKLMVVSFQTVGDGANPTSAMTTVRQVELEQQLIAIEYDPSANVMPDNPAKPVIRFVLPQVRAPTEMLSSVSVR